VETLGRPVFILEELEDGTAKGSGRSFGEFKLNEAVAATSKLLLRGGGHGAAAGLAIKTADIPVWRQAVNDYYNGLKLSDQSKYLRVKSDVDVDRISDLTIDLITELERLEPFGLANERPVFRLKNKTAQYVDRIGSERNHLKLTVTDDRQVKLNLLAFNPPDKWFVEQETIVDLWVNININEWNGDQTVEGKILRLEVVGV
jgi:single-stranded-DNA-specific exonuclease